MICFSQDSVKVTYRKKKGEKTVEKNFIGSTCVDNDSDIVYIVFNRKYNTKKGKQSVSGERH